MIDAKIKCVAPWAGGKRTLAKRIVELLAQHDFYVEPFVGGCSILPAKPRSVNEILNDANPRIFNVLACLRDFPSAVIAAIHDTPFERSSWQLATENLTMGTGGARSAAAQLIAWWMGANGMAGTTRKAWFAQRHSKTGGDPAVRWESFKASLPALAERLKGTTICNEPFERMFFSEIDRTGTAIYCDPPYLSKTFKYECDFSAEEHAALSQRLNEYRKARIVVSYRIADDGERESLEDMYPESRWRWIEANVNKNMASASGAAKRNVELLLVNDAGGA